jgi:hypothetical protein
MERATAAVARRAILAARIERVTRPMALSSLRAGYCPATLQIGVFFPERVRKDIDEADNAPHIRFNISHGGRGFLRARN